MFGIVMTIIGLMALGCLGLLHSWGYWGEYYKHNDDILD